MTATPDTETAPLTGDDLAALPLAVRERIAVFCQLFDDLITYASDIARHFQHEETEKPVEINLQLLFAAIGAFNAVPDIFEDRDNFLTLASDPRLFATMMDATLSAPELFPLPDWFASPRATLDAAHQIN